MVTTSSQPHWSRSTVAFQVEQLILGENINILEKSTFANLKSYKYQSVDKSYLSYYVLNPYWTWCAKFMPPWLAPNVITLLGILAIYINIFCVEIYIPDLVSAAPSWVYYSFAFGLFFYQTMDNIDGKQARRTGMSSPLGELFDHGIDSLNCCLGGLVETACMGLGTSRSGAFTTFCTCIAMYFSTWETYHTHVLYLGYLNGPTEGIIVACLVMIVSGINGGPEIWRMSLREVTASALGDGDYTSFLGMHQDWLLKDIWTVTLVISIVVFHVPFCIYNVIDARRKRGQSITEPLFELVPLAVLTFSIYTWTFSPYSSILKSNHLVLFALTVSFVFGRVTTAIILAHLTKQPFPFWSLPMIPLLVGGLLFGLAPHMGLFYFSEKTELSYLWGYFIFSVIYFARFSQLVINSLCDYLDIPCFTVKRRDQKLS